MAKKPKKITQTETNKIERQTEQLVDKYTRWLQVGALFSVVLLLILRGTIKEFALPDYVIIGLMGLAVGLSPEQIRRMFTDIIKAFIGKK